MEHRRAVTSADGRGVPRLDRCDAPEETASGSSIRRSNGAIVANLLRERMSTCATERRKGGPSTADRARRAATQWRLALRPEHVATRRTSRPATELRDPFFGKDNAIRKVSLDRNKGLRFLSLLESWRRAVGEARGVEQPLRGPQ